MTKKIIRSGELSPIDPPWFKAFKLISANVIPDAARRKSVDVFHSHLYHMINRAMTDQYIAAGFVENGMGVGPNGADGFSFSKHMNHWATYRELPPDVSTELTRIFWEVSVPAAKLNNCTTNHATMHSQLSGLFNLPELDAAENRSNKVLNQGFAMVLNDDVYERFANERLELDAMKKILKDKVDLLKKEEKKRQDAIKKADEDKAALGVDNEYKSELLEINNKEAAAIKKHEDTTAEQVKVLNNNIIQLPKKDVQIENIKKAIKEIEKNSKEAIKIIKTSYKDQKNMLLKCHKKERKRIIAFHNENKQNNGARLPVLPLEIDITGNAMIESDDEIGSEEEDN
jgi:hypothetical protein